MILIWHRPHWLNPIVQEEVRAVELKTYVRVKAYHHGERITTTTVCEITHEDGERERLNVEPHEHLIVLHEDTFKVIL